MFVHSHKNRIGENRMKVTIGQIYRAVEPLSSLAEQQMPIALAFKLRRLIDKVNEELAAVEVARVQLVTRLAEGADRVPDSKMEHFDEEMSQLFGTEVELPDVWLDLSALPKVQISPSSISLIDFMIKEE